MSKRSAALRPEQLQERELGRREVTVTPPSLAHSHGGDGRTSQRQPSSTSHARAAAAASATATATNVTPLPEQRLGTSKRTRRSHRRLDFFALLASVEVQSVLQLLDNHDRLTVMQTSRRLLHEGKQPLSWKYAEKVTVTVRRLGRLPVASSTGSLLQLAPSCLRLFNVRSNDAAVSQALHQHLPSMRGLSELITWGGGASATPRMLNLRIRWTCPRQRCASACRRRHVRTCRRCFCTRCLPPKTCAASRCSLV